MASGDADRHLKSAGIFPKREYLKVTTTFNKFPVEGGVHIGDSLSVSEGSHIPRCTGIREAIKTSLYHYTSRKLAVAFFRQDDDEEGDDDDQPDDNSLED